MRCTHRNAKIIFACVDINVDAIFALISYREDGVDRHDSYRILPGQVKMYLNPDNPSEEYKPGWGQLEYTSFIANIRLDERELVESITLLNRA
jgi:hypothetical protein